MHLRCGGLARGSRVPPSYNHTHMVMNHYLFMTTNNNKSCRHSYSARVERRFLGFRTTMVKWSPNVAIILVIIITIKMFKTDIHTIETQILLEKNI